ncbi:MAG: DUF6880 family protein [Rhodopila sp.]
MASKTTLNAANLEALGAVRLAALLMEISEGNAVIKRRLRLELAGEQSPAEVARQIRKRLQTIARSHSFVDWQNRKALVDDLQAQRRAIVDQVAKRTPAEALDLMWRFLELAKPVLERADDSNGAIVGVFQAAVEDLGDIAEAARPDPTQLADETFRALLQNEYGQYDGLIQTLAPALGPVGLDHLKQRLVALSQEPVSKPAGKDRRIIGYGAGGPLYADEMAARARATSIRLALQRIADAQGDVDAFIAQYDEPARKLPRIAAAIARRLLAAGRAEEAWQIIEAAKRPRYSWPEFEPDFEWEDTRIDVLEAFGRSDEAQAERWSCFERFLSVRHLRGYLKRLPDFDDFEAEQRALGDVERHGNLLLAIRFLVLWPALDRAAKITVERAGNLDGNYYEILTPASEALAAKYPLAATLMLRAMIDFALAKNRSSRFGHAARHLRTCAALAPVIAEWGPFETHDAYVARLRREHGRKTSFWATAA